MKEEGAEEEGMERKGRRRTVGERHVASALLEKTSRGGGRMFECTGKCASLAPVVQHSDAKPYTLHPIIGTSRRTLG